MSLFKNPKYDLKRKYNRVLEISFIVSLTLLVTAFKFFPQFEFDKIENDKVQILFTAEDVIPTEPKPEIPPPPKPIIPIESPTDELMDDFDIEETVLDIDAPIGKVPPKPNDYNDADELIPDFIPVAEIMPAPIGGIEAIMKKITYPEFALRAGIKGKVYVNAFVDEEGNVSKVELLKGIGGGCDEEALAAVMATKFSPGKQRGKTVKVKVGIPIDFRIQ